MEEHSNDSPVELHNQITDLLMDNFMPKRGDEVATKLIRRAVSSISDDIIRLVENHYGVEPK